MPDLKHHMWGGRDAACEGLCLMYWFERNKCFHVDVSLI